jgi:hypothetical protein
MGNSFRVPDAQMKLFYVCDKSLPDETQWSLRDTYNRHLLDRMEKTGNHNKEVYNEKMIGRSRAQIVLNVQKRQSARWGPDTLSLT